MARPMFTPEELEVLRRADAELDETFVQTQEEIESSRQRDREVKHSRKDPKAQKVAEYQRAYREANKEKVAASQRAYRSRKRKQNEALTFPPAPVSPGCEVLR